MAGLNGLSCSNTEYMDFHVRIPNISYRAILYSFFFKFFVITSHLYNWSPQCYMPNKTHFRINGHRFLQRLCVQQMKFWPFAIQLHPFWGQISRLFSNLNILQIESQFNQWIPLCLTAPKMLRSTDHTTMELYLEKKNLIRTRLIQ